MSTTEPALETMTELHRDEQQATYLDLPTSAQTLATSNERLASDAESALRPSSMALTHSQERYASDAKSALWSSPPFRNQTIHQETEMGSVASEQARPKPPPTCAQIPPREAAASARVRRPLPSGNQPLIENLSDLIFLMSTTEPTLETMAELHRDELQAAYLDLSRRSSRPRASSFHATRSAAAVAVRCQDPPLLPRDLQQALERHRHWSVSGTNHHIPDYEFPYRLL